MSIHGVIILLVPFLAWASAFDSYGGENDRVLCTGSFTNLYQWPVVQTPKRVLLVPLLSKNSDTSESERWPEQPAARLEDFYRRRLRAEVVWLRNIHTWDGYYREANRLLAQHSAFFDWVIFIGHGGFDGPVLNRAKILQELSIQGSEGAVVYATEIQPGKQQIFSLSYDVTKNQQFSAYVGANWRDLAQMNPDYAARQLYDMKTRLQPMDNACFERYCASLRSSQVQDEVERTIKMDACQDICRGPLFSLKSQEEIKPERFFGFAGSLHSLTRKDGLVFFGECNPGTTATGNTAG